MRIGSLGMRRSCFWAIFPESVSRGEETKRRKKFIEDKKQRGEWVESLFLARANEPGIIVSKPWGDSRSFDFVVGRPGRFCAVQVKCTTAKLRYGAGYICKVCGNKNKRYPHGSFDFPAAYVVPKEVWYIIPENKGLGNEDRLSRYRARQSEV